MAIPISLTPLEQEILQHRLDVPDAICDGLGGHGWHQEDVAAVVELVAAGNWDEACAICKPIACAALKDAVDGSTYYGAAIGNTSEQEMARILRAGNSLARKVAALIGERVIYPDY